MILLLKKNYRTWKSNSIKNYKLTQHEKTHTLLDYRLNDM